MTISNLTRWGVAPGRTRLGVTMIGTRSKPYLAVLLGGGRSLATIFRMESPSERGAFLIHNDSNRTQSVDSQSPRRISEEFRFFKGVDN